MLQQRVSETVYNQYFGIRQIVVLMYFHACDRMCDEGEFAVYHICRPVHTHNHFVTADMRDCETQFLTEEQGSETRSRKYLDM
jgi:hypothetical protein